MSIVAWMVDKGSAISRSGGESLGSLCGRLGRPPGIRACTRMALTCCKSADASDALKEPPRSRIIPGSDQPAFGSQGHGSLAATGNTRPHKRFLQNGETWGNVESPPDVSERFHSKSVFQFLDGTLLAQTKNNSTSMSGSSHCRILVVEDEPVLAMLLQDALKDMGCSVLFAQEVREAILLAKTEALECAFLDVKIGNETVVPVADALKERNIPFVFSSNFGKELLPQRYRDHVMLPKPYFPDDIAYVFRTQLNIRLSPAGSGL